MSTLLATSAYQQDLEALARIDERILCAPAAFLNVAREKGYDIDTGEYVHQLDWSAYDAHAGWSRPGLARMLRDRYRVSNVSWWIAATGHPFTLTDIERMRSAGYIRTSLELDWLQTIVPKLQAGVDGILALVASGHHSIVTVKPGFGANTTHHAIILTEYDAQQGVVTIFNPDARDSVIQYPETYILRNLSDDGACTVVL